MILPVVYLVRKAAKRYMSNTNARGNADSDRDEKPNFDDASQQIGLNNNSTGSKSQDELEEVVITIQE